MTRVFDFIEGIHFDHFSKIFGYIDNLPCIKRNKVLLPAAVIH